MKSFYSVATVVLVVNFGLYFQAFAQAMDRATIEDCATLGTEIKKFSFLRNEARMRDIEQRLQSEDLITASDIVNVRDQKTVMGMTMCGVIASRGLPFEVGIVPERQGPPLYVLSYLRLQSGRNDNITIRAGKVVGWDAQEGFRESGAPNFSRLGYVHRGPVSEVIYRYNILR